MLKALLCSQLLKAVEIYFTLTLFPEKKILCTTYTVNRLYFPNLLRLRWIVEPLKGEQNSGKTYGGKGNIIRSVAINNSFFFGKGAYKMGT